MEGDVTFGRDVVIRGKVQILHSGEGTLTIEDGTLLEDVEIRR